MGLFHIAGGRGILWFTEIDTLIFDVVLLLAIMLVEQFILLYIYPNVF